MSIITIKKSFGRIVSKKYDKQLPNFRSVKNFLKIHQLQKNTIARVMEQLTRKWDEINIIKKNRRAKNGDIITYKDIKGIKIAKMLDYFAKKDREARKKKLKREKSDENIEVFACQFVRMSYINTIKGYGSLLVRLQNGEIRELFGSQYTLNNLLPPITEILKTRISEKDLKRDIKTDILGDKIIDEITNEFKPQLMVHYKNKFEWAIEPVNVMSIVNKA